MATAKTGTIQTMVALPETLLDEVEAVARALDISRDELLARAVARFLKQERDKQLRAQIEALYVEGAAPEEQAVLDAMWEHQRSVMRESEW